jgi:hypothetical protein
MRLASERDIAKGLSGGRGMGRGLESLQHRDMN